MQLRVRQGVGSDVAPEDSRPADAAGNVAAAARLGTQRRATGNAVQQVRQDLHGQGGAGVPHAADAFRRLVAAAGLEAAMPDMLDRAE